MFTQGMGYFMAQHSGEFGIAGLEFFDQPGIDHDLAARHAPGIDLLRVHYIDFPLPSRRVRAESTDLGDKAIGDGFYPGDQSWLVVDRALGAAVGQGLAVGLACRVLYRFSRDQKAL